tara:strand:- start:1634 stop:1888 length:255 start_codon:yes stop_codon:yes gene_type:complete
VSSIKQNNDSDFFTPTSFESLIMFGWLRRDPRKKLETQYAQKLEQARDAQRNGNIQGYAQLMSEAEGILQQIDSLPASTSEAGK